MNERLRETCSQKLVQAMEGETEQPRVGVRRREETRNGVNQSTWREQTSERGTKRGRAVSKIIGTLSGSLRVRSETIIWGGQARSKVTGKASGSEIGGK